MRQGIHPTRDSIVSVKVRGFGRVVAAIAIALACAWTMEAATPPQSAADLENRVFIRTAPNGAIELFRMRPGGIFEAGSAYRTNTFTYERQNLPANQSLLTFASSDVFSGVPSWRTNRFLLTFETGNSGQYELQFLINTVPTPQTFSGPFEISAGDNIAPRIWRQPESNAAVLGNGMGVTVGAAGFDLTYQWYLNGSPIAGANRASYTVSTMTADLVGDYRCVVSNALGSVTSDAAKVYLLTAPAITRPPIPVSVFEGGSATFTVEASGDQLRYEWKLNGVPVSLNDQPSITLDRLTAAQAGTVTVTILNNAGSVSSDPVPLTVCATAVDSTYQGRPWIRILGSNDPVPATASRFGPLTSPFNPTFTLWQKTVIAIARGDDDVANPPILRNALVRWRDGVLTTLVFTNTLRPDGTSFLYPFYPTDEGAGGIVNFTERDSMFSWQNGSVTMLIDTNTPAPGRSGVFFFGPGSLARRGGNVLVASTLVNADRSDAGTGLYLHDGTTLRRIVDNTTDLPGVMPGYAFRTTEDSLNLDDTTLVFSTSSSLNGPAGVYRSTYDGVVTKLLDTDDLIPGLTNRIVNFGDVDVQGDLVFAVAQVRVGNAAQGRVVAFERDGTARLVGSGEYLVAAGPRQVFFGNTGSISRWTDGVTETVINTAAVIGCRRLAGFYDVDAQGDDIAIGVIFADRSVGIYANFGAPDSGATAPKFLAHPRDQSVPATTPAMFSAAVSAAGPIQYQWRRHGIPLPNGTNAVFTVLSTADADAGTYDVIATSGGASVTSTAARLTLTAPPAIPIVFVQPQTAAVPIGSPVTLSVSAAGAPPLSYQWLVGTSPTPIDGATAASLTITPTSNSVYRVTISNTSATVTSLVASVSLVPILVRQPEPVTAPVGGTATFTVQATGFEQYRYTWLRNSIAVPGATNATFTISPVTLADAGEYSVFVAGIGGGLIRSARVMLTVQGSGGGSDPQPAALRSVGLENGKLRFEFQAAVGTVYAVETTPHMQGGPWTEVSRIVGDGTTHTVRLGADGASGFVRVRSQAP